MKEKFKIRTAVANTRNSEEFWIYFDEDLNYFYSLIDGSRPCDNGFWWKISIGENQIFQLEVDD